MKLSVVLQRTEEGDDGACAVEPICLPELGVFGVMRGLSASAGPRGPLDAARVALAALYDAAASAEPAERCRLTLAALQRAMACSADFALELVVVAIAEERAFLACIGTCNALLYRDGRYRPLATVDALPGGPQGGYLVVTKVLSAAFHGPFPVVELPLHAGERVALVSPRVARGFAIASPALALLGTSLGGHALFLSELASDLADPDACVVMFAAD